MLFEGKRFRLPFDSIGRFVCSLPRVLHWLSTYITDKSRSDASVTARGDQRHLLPFPLQPRHWLRFLTTGWREARGEPSGPQLALLRGRAHIRRFLEECKRAITCLESYIDEEEALDAFRVQTGDEVSGEFQARLKGLSRMANNYSRKYVYEGQLKE